MLCHPYRAFRTGLDFYHAINVKDPEQNDVVPNDDYHPRALLMDPIIYVGGWPQVPGDSPSYDQQSGPGVAIDLFTWVRQRTFKP